MSARLLGAKQRFNRERFQLPKYLPSARCSPFAIFKLLAARMRKLITARARKNKRTARMLAKTIRYPSQRHYQPIVPTRGKYPDEQWSSVKIFLQISGLIENKILLSGFLSVLFFQTYVSNLSVWYSPLGNLMFLKLACLFCEHQIFEGRLSIDSSSTEILYCLNRYWVA